MKCRSSRRDGSPCRMPAGENGKCYAHDPGRAEQRRATRAAGGAERGRQLARKPSAEVMDPDNLMSFDDLEVAQREVALGLLAGRLGAKEALARTRVLAALADRVKDSDRDAAERERDR